ncbi:hypothetical protein GALL_367390 [mine drainage metagenome]|uniref:Uncharacterized protein n=1 Tax=mine drainage metagenome TaxID=410659 RepID=A0A1J5QCZ4_9ZZZZ
MDQPDAANHRRLCAEVDGLAANVDVAVVDDGEHLGQGQAVAHELVQIHGDVVGLGLAAPAIDVDDARDGLEAPFEYPVFDGLEIGHRIAGGAGNMVAIDFADGAGGRNLGLHVVGQRRQFGQLVDHPLLGLFIGEIKGEADLDIGQAEQGNCPHGGDVRDAGHLDFDRDGDVTLDLFG